MKIHVPLKAFVAIVESNLGVKCKMRLQRGGCG